MRDSFGRITAMGWACRICVLGGMVLIASAPRSTAQALVDIATNATDPGNLADTEPSIAVNPANPLDVIVVTFSEGWGPGLPAPIWRSTDGGTTWTKLFVLPQPNPASGGPGDQKIAFTSGGNLHVVELAGGLAPPRCLIFRQTGAAGALLTAGVLFCDDQPHLEIDQSTSAFAGRAYSPWLDFSQANERSTVTRSANGGAAVTNVGMGSNASFPNRTTRAAVGPDGKVYVIYKTREGTVAGGLFENAHFRVHRSDDGGVSWSAIGATGVSVHGAGTVQTWFTNSFGNAAKGKVGRARSSDAWISVDPGDGDVYAVFCQKDASGFGQIFVARSIDDGSTWTTTRVSDGTHHSAYPEVAVAANGTVGVLYVDFDDSGAATLFRHRFARSFNDGASWSNEILQSMDPGPIANATSGFLWGDYEGLTASGSAFYGVFTGQSIGRGTLQLDPIFFRRSATRFTLPPCARKWWLCQSPVKLEPGILVLKCPLPGCIVIDPIPKNCLVKFTCPGCEPGGLCPPFYNMFFDGLDPAWKVSVVDPRGQPVAARQLKTESGIVVSFRPAAALFKDGKIGDYSLVFQMGPGGKPGTEMRIKTRLEASNKPLTR
jgi:hypothetical protein